MQDTIRLTKALSDETRLRVLNLLMERECCVCEVMQVLGISQSRASRNLSELHDAGIFKMRKEGRWALYSLDREGMDKRLLKMVEAIEEKLRTDRQAVQDRKQLQKAERIGPTCVCEPSST